MKDNHEKTIIYNAQRFLSFGKDMQQAQSLIHGLLLLVNHYKNTIEQIRQISAPKGFFIYENKSLNIPLESIGLSVRAYNCIQAYNDTLKQPILTIGDLVRLPHNEIRKIPNFGRKLFDELLHLIEAQGVEWTVYGVWGDAVKQKLAI